MVARLVVVEVDNNSLVVDKHIVVAGLGQAVDNNNLAEDARTVVAGQAEVEPRHLSVPVVVVRLVVVGVDNNSLVVGTHIGQVAERLAGLLAEQLFLVVLGLAEQLCRAVVAEDNLEAGKRIVAAVGTLVEEHFVAEPCRPFALQGPCTLRERH